MGRESNDGTPDGQLYCGAMQAAVAKDYAAFISYSHAVDGKLAPAIQLALQRFAKPWYRRQAIRIFRDEASLAVNPGLWSAIERALAASEFFILLASPESAASRWVNREVEYWLTQSTADRLLIVVTAGQIAWDSRTGDFDWTRTTALPAALTRTFREEPLYLDLRWARSEEDLTLKHPGFHAAIADLAATVRGWHKDEIVGEDIRQHRRTVRLAWSAAGVLAVLSVAASSAAALFLYQRQIAQQRELEARQHLYTAHINQALVAARGGDTERAGMALQLQIPTEGQSDLRGFEWYYLWRQSHRELATFPGLPLARIAFSPDGARLAAAGAEGSPSGEAAGAQPADWINRGELRIWDTQSARQLVVAPSPRRISGIAFSPDGTLLAAVTQAAGPAILEGNDVMLLRVDGGSPAWVRREKLNFEAVAFHPHGTWIATAGLALASGFRGQVSLWDVKSATQTVLDLGPIGWIRALAFSPDGENLSIAWDSGPGSGHSEVWIWSVAQGAVRLRLATDAAYITSVAFSPDGTRLIAGGDEGTVAWWSLPGGALERVVRGHRGLVHSVAVAPNGRVLASGGWDQTAVMWDMNTGETIATLPKQPNVVESVAFAPDGLTLATASNGTIKTWNVSQELGQDDTVLAHRGGIAAMAFTADGAMIATGGPDGAIRLWQGASRRAIGTLDLGTTRAAVATGVKSVAFSPDRLRLAATGDVGTKVWNLQSQQLEYSTAEIPGEALLFSSDGARLLVGGEAAVFAIDLATKQPRRLVSRRAETMALSPDGTLLATSWGSAGPSESSVWIWDAATGSPHCELRGHAQGAFSLAFSPDGAWLASAGYVSGVKIWNTRRCAERATLLERQDHVGSVAFSPDGRTLAAATSGRGLSEEASVALWSTATWEELFRLPAGMHGVRTVAFSPTGRMLAAAGDNSVLNESGTLRFWRAAATVAK